jgi:hypothetical protein
MIEVWIPKRRYLHNLFPSDGNVWEHLDEIQKKHPRAYLVEVKGGKRERISAKLSADQISDDEV